MIKPNSRFWAWAAFLLASMFYLYEFCLQVSPTVMTDVLMRDFHTTAAGVGVISGFYFYAYTLMQIPVGILYDRFSPRRVLAFASLIAASGAYAFASTNLISVACLARFMMGFGSAFAFVAVVIFCNRWFKPVYFATLIGVAQLMSSIGAISAETPLELAVHSYGWQETMRVIAFAGVILAFFIYFFAHDGPKDSEKEQAKSWRNELSKLTSLFKSSQTWAIGAYTFFIWSPMTAFAGLWGVPFIRTVYHVSQREASLYSIIIWVAVGLASPIVGIISDGLKDRRRVLYMSSLIGLLGSTLLIATPTISGLFLAFCLACIGVAAGGQALSFAVVNDNNAPHFVGTASGINNMATVAGGAIFQPLMGYLIKLFSHGEILNGVPVYSATAYQLAMIIVPLCFFASFIASFYFLRESYPR